MAVFSVIASPLSRRSAERALRMDLEIGRRALLALAEVDALRLVCLAALLEHDVSGQRARAWCVVEREQDVSSSWFAG
jgi:hypothetical protein